MDLINKTISLLQTNMSGDVTLYELIQAKG